MFFSINLSPRMVQLIVEIYDNPDHLDLSYSHFISTVRALEDRGIVNHKHPNKPPYELTDFGKALAKFLSEVKEIGR